MDVLAKHCADVERNPAEITTAVRHMQWELIEPLDGESVNGRFLAEKGEGVHTPPSPLSDTREDPE